MGWSELSLPASATIAGSHGASDHIYECTHDTVCDPPWAARRTHEDNGCGGMSGGCYSSEGAERHGYMPRSLTEASKAVAIQLWHTSTCTHTNQTHTHTHRRGALVNATAHAGEASHLRHTGPPRTTPAIPPAPPAPQLRRRSSRAARLPTHGDTAATLAQIHLQRLPPPPPL